jgi:hypothetical protein
MLKNLTWKMDDGMKLTCTELLADTVFVGITVTLFVATNCRGKLPAVQLGGSSKFKLWLNMPRNAAALVVCTSKSGLRPGAYGVNGEPGCPAP